MAAVASRQAEVSLFTPLLSVVEKTLRQLGEISCHPPCPHPWLVWAQGWHLPGLAVGRVLCRAQGLGTAWGKKEGRKSCSSSCAPSAAASPAPCGVCGSLCRGKAEAGEGTAGAGDSCGCCVTLGSLSSQTVPCPADPGANPLERGLFPFSPHSHWALCWFGAVWCLSCCVSSVTLLPWLSQADPASSKALTLVLPSMCGTSDSLCPPSPSGQAGCNFHEILLGRAVPGLS